jgi:hypothetical protein
MLRTRYTVKGHGFYMNSKFYFLMIFFCISPYVSASKLEIESPFHPDEPKVLHSWLPENLTSPKALSATSSFRFVYHGLTQLSDWTLKILSNPQELTRNLKISASLIDQDHRTVFTQGFGLILKVPPANIIATHSVEARTNRGCHPMGSYTEALPCLLDLSSGYNYETYRNDPFSTPSELLKATPKLNYNEVLITGRISNSESIVETKAIVVICDTDKNITSWEDSKIWEEIDRCLSFQDLTTSKDGYLDIDKKIQKILDAKSRGIEVLTLKLQGFFRLR